MFLGKKCLIKSTQKAICNIFWNTIFLEITVNEEIWFLKFLKCGQIKMQLNLSQITFLLKHEISLFIFTYKIHKILQEVDVKIKIFLFS